MPRQKYAPKLLFLAITMVELAGALQASTQSHARHSRPDSHRYSVANVRVFVPSVTTDAHVGTDAQASWGAPIAVAPLTGSVWVTNPDADSVSVVDAVQFTKLAEIRVGREPWSIAMAPDGRAAYVVERAGGTLSVIDTTTYRIRKTVHVGAEPGALALSPSGATAFVSITSAHEVVVVDTTGLTVEARLATQPYPYAISVSDDGDADDLDEHVYVTHLLAMPRPGGAEATDDGRDARITVLGTGTRAVESQVSLGHDLHGFPNLLSAIALAGGRAWVPHIRAAPGLPNGLTTTVFAAVASLDLAANNEDASARIMLNDERTFGSPVNNPIAAVPSPDATTLYVVLAGSNLVEVIDVAAPTQPRLLKFLPVGTNPRGIALSQDGRRGYVMNYLSRSMTVLDLERQEVITTVFVAGETLDPQQLRGKILFNSAVTPQMARSSWMSCASCHADGGTDGVTWMFPDGTRQTPPLWNAARTLPWHWSAALDELQDVEDTVHSIQLGLGLAPGPDPALLGEPNAGRSADLDALAAYMEHGIRIPSTLPFGADQTEARQLFVSAGCVACHAGPEWTISARPGAPGTLDPDGNGMLDSVHRDVGTFTIHDVRGATGFDVPSLIDVSLSAPYLHDGSMADLSALLVSGHPDPRGSGNGLTAAEINVLVAFLRSIGPLTPPLER